MSERAPIVGRHDAPTHSYTQQDLEWAAQFVGRHESRGDDLKRAIDAAVYGWSSGCGAGPSWHYGPKGFVMGTLDGRVVRIPYADLISQIEAPQMVLIE